MNDMVRTPSTYRTAPKTVLLGRSACPCLSGEAGVAQLLSTSSSLKPQAKDAFCIGQHLQDTVAWLLQGNGLSPLGLGWPLGLALLYFLCGEALTLEQESWRKLGTSPDYPGKPCSKPGLTNCRTVATALSYLFSIIALPLLSPRSAFLGE